MGGQIGAVPPKGNIANGGDRVINTTTMYHRNVHGDKNREDRNEQIDSENP
jgi:hypothetical protein